MVFRIPLEVKTMKTPFTYWRAHSTILLSAFLLWSVVAEAETVQVTITANVIPRSCTLFGQTGASPATVSFGLDTSAPIFIPAGTQIGPFANDLIFTDLYGYQKSALSAISASYGNKMWDTGDVSDGPLGGYAPNPSATVWFNGPVTVGGNAIPTIVFDDSDGRLVPGGLACGVNDFGGGCGLLDRMDIFAMTEVGFCDGISGPLEMTVSVSTPALTSFSSFNVKQLLIDRRKRDLFFLSNFTLGQGTNGIDPLKDLVTLNIGNITTKIPAGSFRKVHKLPYTFVGVIDNILIKALINPLGGNQFLVQVAEYGANLSSIMNPVNVTLTIGDDTGTTSFKAIIK